MNSVDKYIDGYSGDVRERLEIMRKIVMDIVPNAKESFAYGMPAYSLGGKPLAYFAAFSKHIGFYATPSGHDAFRDELARYKHGKGSVQFPLTEPLPIELIRSMVDLRKKQIEGS